jgi:aminoglycoside 3-N-acetyltransferase
LADYGAADLREALAALPIERGDILFSHSNIGFFGRPEGIRSADELCQQFMDILRERIGPEGTFVVPTFTYSFPRRQVFDPAETGSAMGMLAEWVRRHPEARRSADPSYSVAALGGRADELTRDPPENSFAAGSFFDRFHADGGKILNLNFDAGSTFVHYVERRLDVPYRFDKTFRGQIRIDGVEQEAASTIWVRYLSDDLLEAAFEPMDALAREKGLFKTVPLGRGEISLITADDTFKLIEDTLPHRPWLLTRADGVRDYVPNIVPETPAA